MRPEKAIGRTIQEGRSEEQMPNLTAIRQLKRTNGHEQQCGECGREGGEGRWETNKC